MSARSPDNHGHPTPGPDGAEPGRRGSTLQIAARTATKEAARHGRRGVAFSIASGIVDYDGWPHPVREA